MFLSAEPMSDPSPHRMWRAVAITGAVMVALVLAAVVAVWAITGNHQEAADAKDIANQIQLERVRSIREGCEAQNQRHDYTIRTLDSLIAKAPLARRAQARANRSSTVLLLEAIVPHRDCAAVVRQQAPSG